MAIRVFAAMAAGTVLAFTGLAFNGIAYGQNDNGTENEGGPPPIRITPDEKDAPSEPTGPQTDEPLVGDPATQTAANLRAAVQRIDPRAVFTPNGAQFTVGRIPVVLIYDLGADRMRIMSPVAEGDTLGEEELLRIMRANFESALDARYALANGYLWSTFIHPLSPLDGAEFASGLGQVVNLVLTYGSSYNSGAVTFGSGEQGGEPGEGQELIQELEDKARDI